MRKTERIAYRIELTALSLVLLFAPAVATGHTGGVLQTKAQQACLVAMNKSLAKVAKAQGKQICACIKDGAREKLGTSIEDCLTAVGSKVEAAEQKTLAQWTDKCLQDVLQIPDFGYTSGPAVNAAGVGGEIALVHAIFGSDLDTAIVKENASTPPNAKATSKCQIAVAKQAKKCFDTKLKEFIKCKKAGLKAKVPPGQIDRAEDLSELCLMQDPNDPTTGQPDAKSKIVKACVEKLAQKIDKKCAGVDLALAFPGFDPNDSLQAHVDARVECEVCQAINAADGLTRSCDLFDDGVANESCGGVLPGCAGEGAEPDFESTFEGIQTVIFDGYGCNNSLCHHASDFPAGGLDLTPGNAHGNLVAVPSTISALKRVDPGDQDLSFLYAKLAAATLGAPLTEGGPMPLGGAISTAHLEAIRLWIRGGAPSDLVVEGTAELLGSCLPEPQPLTMPVPDPPGAGLGAQLQQTPWDLGLQSEEEICMATYYNLAATSLVPEAAKVPCPPSYVIPSNPTGECVLYHKLVLYQDSQSHHSIITLYGGQETTAHPAWGPFTFKFSDPNNPLQGMSCDPTAVDPNTGYNPGCSGAVTNQLACLGFGPPDFSVGFGTSPNLNVSQEPLHVAEYADGVYNLIPMAGILAWNSHAFNLTNFDTTLSQYLNLHFADPDDQLYPVESIFDVSAIFVMNVAPFETEEYCKTYTMAQGTRLFHLASHTHRHGVRFRIWEPPNAPCFPGPGCVPGNPGQLIYLSTDYTDPVQLEFDPPIALDDAAVADRTYLYCSLYDNGSTPSSPEVSRNSHPIATCGAGVRECLSGPNKSVLCGGDDAFCDSSPGAGDGECDACPVTGGVTTEGDMFVLFGSFYTP